MSEHQFEAMRQAMVASQLRTTAVSDERVVAAMQTVPRELFVPQDRRSLAYIDVPIPVGPGRSLNAPMATGRLLTEANIAPTDKVLLIGAATGYAAALLARLAGTVLALEEDQDLVRVGAPILSSLPNISLVSGPLSAGWAEGAPYDLIVIDGAVECVPGGIADQIKMGGRLVGALDENGVTRLAKGVRVSGGFGMVAFADVEVPVLPGFARAKAFRF